MYARIYTRVSTEEQATSGFSLSGQMERLEAFCASQGWDVAGRYIDEGVSAKNLDRPEFRRMMSEIQKGDVVLVYKLDRLTRSVRDLDDLLRDFDRRGIAFRSATEQFDTTTATGRLFIRMVAEMAQWERETIAERTVFGKHKKAASGEWGGGPIPFGYIGVPSDKVKAGRTLMKLVPDPDRAHVVPMIYERYLSGHGIRDMSLWLNDELGMRSVQGSKFHRITVRRILTNPIYCGDVEHGRRAGRTPIRVPGTHPPLVSREVFERAQTLIENRKLMAPRQATGMYPLSGVAHCGVCGGRIDGHKRSDKENGLRIYRCHNYMIGVNCGQDGQRSLASVSADRVEEAFAAEIDRLHHEPAEMDRLLDQFRTQAEAKVGLTQAELNRLEQDIADAEAAIARWKRLFEKGRIDDDEYLAEVKPHKERMHQLKEQLEIHASNVVELPSRQALGEFVINFREAWEELEPPERKALVQRFVQAFKMKILIHPGRRVELRPAL